MSLKPIMNADGSVNHKTGSPISGGSFVITSTSSTNVKANGSGVYRGKISGTFSGGNATGFVSGTVAGAWSIDPTAQNVKADGLKVIRKDDEGTLNATGTISPPASPPTGTVSGTVIVSNAGQGDVNGD